MKQVEPANFSFESFKISYFSFNEENYSSTDLELNFEPQGVYDERNGNFELTLLFTVYGVHTPNSIIFNVKSVANFKFKTPIKIEELPKYFYPNSIAIIYPYIRAFISTMTIQANTKLLKLGLLNLSGLANVLKENTTKI